MAARRFTARQSNNQAFGKFESAEAYLRRWLSQQNSLAPSHNLILLNSTRAGTKPMTRRFDVLAVHSPEAPLRRSAVCGAQEGFAKLVQSVCDQELGVTPNCAIGQALQRLGAVLRFLGAAALQRVLRFAAALLDHRVY
jgi:hypothetical protein